MIKVNLATRKQAIPTETVGKALPSLGRFRVDLGDIQDLPIKSLVIHVIAAAAVYWLADSYKQEQMAIAEGQLQKVTAEHARLEKELIKTKVFEKDQQALEEDLKMIRLKIDIIEKLVADRSTPPKLLLSIAKAIPKDVWLSEFRVSNSEVTFRGTSLGFNQISDFMKNLNEDVFFKEVSLKTSNQIKDRSGLEVATFELGAKRK